MQGPIFITFLSCLATLCTTLFLIQTVRQIEYFHIISHPTLFIVQTAENFDYLFIQLVLINMVLTSYVFVFCFIGTIITDKCFEMAKIVFETNWYASPIEHQRYVILILARSQKPFYFHGYGFVPCSLMMFKSVSNSNDRQRTLSMLNCMVFRYVIGDEHGIFILYGPEECDLETSVSIR